MSVWSGRGRGPEAFVGDPPFLWRGCVGVTDPDARRPPDAFEPSQVKKAAGGRVCVND
jgi:hypothetical protein